MTYEELRQECLRFGDYHPSAMADVPTIVDAIARKHHPFPGNLARQLAQCIEDLHRGGAYGEAAEPGERS